jgi:hypothetical protein
MADVKLFEPQRLTDNPDGGGLATTNEVVDGQVNNLFSDISRIDRVNGDVSLRKVFVQAATPNTDLYSGLHCIIQAPPLDPRVSAVLFETSNWAEERAGAQAFVESYLGPSVITRFIPYDRQLAGQRTVLVFTRPEISLPEIGEVYCLSNEVTDAVEYFRIVDIDHEVQTFTDASGDFRVRVITITVGQPLTQEFQGVQPNRLMASGNVVVRRTLLADAARFYGVAPLAVDADIGDLTIKLGSIFGQLVPSATTEVAVLDAPPFMAGGVLTSGSDAIEVSLGLLVATASLATNTRYLTTGMAPDTVQVRESTGGSTWYDDDAGVIHGDNYEVTLDYYNGSLTIDPQFNKNYLVNFVPAVGVSAQAITAEAPVEIANRGYVYTRTLFPLPAPGSVTVQYRALGRWYELTDDRAGRLTGDAGVGAGSVNYQSGTVAVTLGALPDIGSSVLYAWGTQAEYEIKDGDGDIELPAITLTLEAGNCEPGSLTITWTAGSSTKTASDNGSGLITGDATGRIIYATGEVSIRPTVLPNPSTTFAFDYDAASTEEDLFTPSKSGGNITLSAASAPMRPGSVKVTYAVARNWKFGLETVTRVLVDDGVGGLRTAAGTVLSGAAVDYTTGDVVFNPDFAEVGITVARTPLPLIGPGPVVSSTTGYYAGVPQTGSVVTGLSQSSQTYTFVNGTAVTLTYKIDSATDGAQSEETDAPPLVLDLLPRSRSAVIARSVQFTLGGKVYYDRAGSIYHTQSVTTGAGTLAGSINYATGNVTLTSWTGGAATGFSIQSLLTQVAPLPLRLIHGRAPGSPLRPASFQITATRYVDSAQITAIADNNGNIDTADMHGYVDVTTGVFSVAFGRWVLDSSLTSDEKAEDWYDTDFIDEDGNIFKPAEVVPGTVRFNCVVQTSLPQDPEVIGINPVRLPSDGRVPVFRPGYTLVVSDTQAYTMPDALTSLQEVTLPRDLLGSVALYDQDGLGIPTDLFTVDLDAGVVTMVDDLDLSGYNEPLVALHTIEDMALCTDAQITGEVSLGNPLTHAYSADNAVCSAALIVGEAGGDVQARYTNLFEQNTWTVVWSDVRIGSAPTSGAQYDDVTYPLTLLNRDAISQRWALIFTSSTAFNIVSEERGVIGTGNTSTNVAPVNPATGQPYFVMDHTGFGAGWATGNVIRFETVAAGAPMWVARTVKSGPATVSEDRVRIQARWDKD